MNESIVAEKSKKIMWVWLGTKSHFKNRVCSLWIDFHTDILLCKHCKLCIIYPHLRKGNIRQMMSNSTNFSVISDWNIDWREHSYLIAYIGTPILVLGILMNLSGIIILLSKQKTHKSIFHKLIIFLAIWDLSYLTFSLMTLIVFFHNPNSSYVLNTYAYPVQFTLLTGSIYSTVAMTLDRYLLTYIQRVLA